MSKEKVVVHSTEEVVKLLTIAMDDNIIHMETIGELLGMKWVDSLLPKFNNEPEWGYEGLRKFFVDNGIEFSSTLKSALEKLNH